MITSEYSMDEHPSSYFQSKYPPNLTVGQSNVNMAQHYYQQQLHQEGAWQQGHQLQQYQMEQQLQPFRQGRRCQMFHNQPWSIDHPVVNVNEGSIHYSQNYLPPSQNYDRFNNPPISLDNFQSISEDINKEIRVQAELQRRKQQHDKIDSDLAYDPYLICPKCKLQFREGQLPEYRHHIDNCSQ